MSEGGREEGREEGREGGRGGGYYPQVAEEMSQGKAHDVAGTGHDLNHFPFNAT